jgi:hypothetical protein
MTHQTSLRRGLFLSTVDKRMAGQGVGAARRSEATRTRPLDAAEATKAHGMGVGDQGRRPPPAPLTTEGDSLPSRSREGRGDGQL